MKTSPGPSKAKRPRKLRASASPAPSDAGESEPVSRRLHGDSYADVSSREDELAVTTSTHVARTDRRFEEPSETCIDAQDLQSGAPTKRSG